MAAPKRNLGLLLLGLASVTWPALADVYGTPDAGLVARSDSDYCTGCLFAYVQAPAGVSGNFISWAFFSTDNHSPEFDVGRSITPLLFDANFNIIGIGTTRTVPLGGPQSYSFGLAPGGTDVVTAGDWFGWRDGGINAPGNNGIISLDTTGGPGVYYYTCSNSTNNPSGTQSPCYYPGTPDPIAVGNSFTGLFSNSTTEHRTYSVNFTVPEPDSYALIFLSLAGSAVVILRQRSLTRP